MLILTCLLLSFSISFSFVTPILFFTFFFFAIRSLYAFHLSAYFLIAVFPPRLPVLRPDHNTIMQRQSEKLYHTYPTTAALDFRGLVKAGNPEVFFFCPSHEIDQQWYSYLLNINENTCG